jgi:hypothetical protein
MRRPPVRYLGLLLLAVVTAFAAASACALVFQRPAHGTLHAPPGTRGPIGPALTAFVQTTP